MPPNKYFEIEAIDLDTVSVQSKIAIHLECPVFPLSPRFVLNETNTVFIIYPKGIPWLNKQTKVHNS